VETGRVGSADRLHLRRSGALLLALFAQAWAVGSLAGLSGWAVTAVLAVSVPTTLVAVVLAARVPPEDAGEPVARDWRRRYNRIGAVQGVLVAATVVGCVVAQRPEFIAALVCLVVGLHFLPLARILAEPRYVRTGLALCVVGLGGLGLGLAVEPAQANVSVGLAAALTLWASSLALSRCASSLALSR
jgi:hypothetical protein